MISPSILKAQSQLLQSKAEFVIQVTHKSTPYFAVVTAEKVFFCDNQFTKVRAQIEYHHIDRIIISTLNPCLFQLHMNDRRNQNVPPKMSIHTLHRRSVVRYIQFAWKTDYMHTNLEVRALPLYKCAFEDKRPATSLFKSPALTLMELNEDQGFMDYIINGYRFWLPKEFHANPQQLGVYKHSADKTCQLNIQVGETHPLEVLHLIGDRSDLQFYAESFLEQIMIQEMADYEHTVQVQETEEDDDDGDSTEAEVEQKDDGLRNDYWVLGSRPYLKRENIINDPAEWRGWEVHARTLKREVIVIIMRRKYQPPLMENYNDIVIAFYGPEGKDTLKVPDEEVEEEEEELIPDEEEHDEPPADHSHEAGDKEDDGKDLETAFEKIHEGMEFLHLVRGIGDTFQTIHNVIEKYDTMIRSNLNALLFDEESVEFLQYRMGMVPTYIGWGAKLLDGYFGMILSHTENQAEQDKFKRLRAALHSEWAAELKNVPDSTGYDVKKDPYNYIKCYENHGYTENKAAVEPESKRAWNYKLSRYLAYCVDGGLLGNQFCLKDFYELMSANMSKHCRESLNALFDYFFYALPESSGAQIDFVKGDFQKRLQKMVSQKYVFNVRVACSMLENNYFTHELLKSDQVQLYTELLIYLLLQAKSSRIKISVCKHIISFHASLRSETGAGVSMDVVSAAFKPLVSPLLLAYQSPNKQLSTFACVALYNMCTNVKEFKYLIMKENATKILLEKLNSRDIKELTYTLKLIYVLLSIVQHVEQFMAVGLLEKMFCFLKKIDIPGAFYSVSTLTSVCQILKVCLQQDTKKVNPEAMLKLVANLYLNEANIYRVNVNLYLQLLVEIINVITKIAIRNPVPIIKIVNDTMSPLFIKQLCNPVLYGQPSNQTLQAFIEKLVFVLCVIVNHQPDTAKDWARDHPEIIDVVYEYEADSSIPNIKFLANILSPPKKEQQ